MFLVDCIFYRFLNCFPGNLYPRSFPDMLEVFQDKPGIIRHKFSLSIPPLTHNSVAPTGPIPKHLFASSFDISEGCTCIQWVDFKICIFHQYELVLPEQHQREYCDWTSALQNERRLTVEWFMWKDSGNFCNSHDIHYAKALLSKETGFIALK